MSVSTIKQSGASPAGDFTSLFSWDASKQADITGLGPEEAECYGFVDTTAVLIVGWTTTAADYIRIYGAPTADGGEEAGIHDGRSRDVSGVGYQLSSLDTPLTLKENYIRVEDFDIVATNTSGNVTSVLSGASSGDFPQIKRMIIHDAQSSASGGAVLLALGEDTLIENTIIYGNKFGIRIDGAPGANIVEHCTIYGGGSFGILANAQVTLNNCYSGGYTSEDFFTGFTAPSGDYNMSADTSATVDFANGVGSKAATDQFVNASLGSSADFTPKSGADIIAAAPRLGSVLTDIVGASRVDPTTIGAWEFIEDAGVSANPVASLLGL